MRVLYISDYRNLSDSGLCSMEYMRALKSAGAEVVARPIIRTGLKNTNIPDDIIEFEKADQVGCEYVIQQVPPHQLDYDGRFKKNVGFWYLNHLPHAQHPNWLAMRAMDDMWFNTNIPVELNLGENKGKVCIPIPMSAKIKPSPKDDVFRFYTITRLDRQKNLADVIRAFHTEFKPSEPVELVIKISNVRVEQPAALFQNCLDMITKMKEGLGLHTTPQGYKQEQIIVDHLADLDDLHKQCNCLVLGNRGDAFNLHSTIALSYGNDVVSHGQLGLYDTTYKVDSFYDSIIFEGGGSVGTTAKDFWKELKVSSLMEKMRAAFNQNNPLAVSFEDRTYENIGKQMVEALLS